jgi:hypothetical protein
VTESFYLSFSPHCGATGPESLHVNNPFRSAHPRIPRPLPSLVSVKPRRQFARVSRVEASVIAEEQVHIVGHRSLPPVVDLMRCSPTPVQSFRSASDSSKQASTFMPALIPIHIAMRPQGTTIQSPSSQLGLDHKSQAATTRV